MNRSMWAGAVALALIGCFGQKNAPDAVTAGDEVQDDAASYARSTAKEVYTDVRRGKLDTSQSLFADDVFAVGPRAGDVFTNRTDAVLAVTSVFDAGEKHKLRSKGLVAEASVTGKSAWIVDRVDIDRRRHTVVSVLAEIDEIWYVVAVHVAATSPGGAKELPPLPGGAGAAGAVVDLVRAGAQDPALFVDQLSDHQKVTVLGPGKSDHLRGAGKIKKKWAHKKRPKPPAPFALVGDVRGGVTPDGGIAWIVANARVGDDELHRMMFVYERTGDAWRLVAYQDSTP